MKVRSVDGFMLPHVTIYLPELGWLQQKYSGAASTVQMMLQNKTEDADG